MSKEFPNFTKQEFKYTPSIDDIFQNENNETSPVDKEILKPFKHITSVSGKNIRQTLIEVLNYWLKIPHDKLEKISEIIYNFHNVSLLVDDIQDGSILRRGIPAAHSVFGIMNTVLSANYVNLINVEIVMNLNHSEVPRVFIESSKKILAGQGMELYWRDNFKCPTEEEYIQMVTRKTSGVLLLAKDLMQLFSTTNKDMEKLILAIGLYFQINDDYQNLNSQVFFDNKGFCEDLTEGKFGFPIVHAINTRPEEGKLIIDILSKRTYDVELKKNCISLIEKCGSFEYTTNKLTELKETIFEELSELEENPLLEGFLHKIV